MTATLGWTEYLVLMLVGGIVAVDGTSFGQVMVSRPFVAATLGGLIVGDPVQGATMGLILEAFHLGVLPVGAAKYPEGGPAAVAAAAVYAGSDLQPSNLLVLVLFALLLEWLGGQTVQLLRRVNVHLMSPPAGSGWTAGGLERRHLAAIALDYLRGMLLVAVGILVLYGIAERLVPLWGLGERLAEGVLWGMVAGLFASAIRFMGSRLWLAAVGAAGALIVVAI